MNLETLLWSLLVVCCYVGASVVRTHRRQFAIVMFIIAGACGVALAGVRLAVPVALGAAACVLIISPLLRRVSRWLVRREYFTVGDALLAIAAVLAPGAGADEERAGVRMLRQVRKDGIDVAIKALLAARREVSSHPQAIWSIDERIVLMYASSGRWQDAIDYAKAHLHGGATASADEAQGRPPTGMHLISPAQVELMAAKARCLDMDGAIAAFVALHQHAQTLAQPPQSPPGIVAPLLHRARLLLLAHAGCGSDVDRLLAQLPNHAASKLQRCYLNAIAAMRSGDVTSGNAHLAKASHYCRRDSRQRALLAQVQAMSADDRISLTSMQQQQLQQIASLSLPVIVRSPSDSRLVTAPVLLAMLGLGFVLHLTFGDSVADSASYARAGALTTAHLEMGQWWRLITSVFLHIGVSHLLLNAMAIWTLARIAETVFGRMATFALFCIGGIGGAAASYLMLPAGIAAGASGATMALLGGVLVEIAVHRRTYPLAWRRGVTAMMLLVALAQFIADVALLGGVHWAHMSGWICGMLVAPLLSPSWKRTLVPKWIATAIVLASLALLSWGVVAIAQGSLSQWYAQQPQHEVTLPSVTMSVPASLEFDGAFVSDKDLDVSLRVSVVENSSAEQALDAWMQSQDKAAAEQGKALQSTENLKQPDTINGWLIVSRRMIDEQGQPTGRQLTMFAKIAPNDSSRIIVGTLNSSPWFAFHERSAWLGWIATIVTA
jgi:rhomboid protease GluP